MVNKSLNAAQYTFMIYAVSWNRPPTVNFNDMALEAQAF